MLTDAVIVLFSQLAGSFSFRSVAMSQLGPFLFLQLVNIGSQYSYSSEDQSEFLVVVSREFDEPPRSADIKPTDKEMVSHMTVM